MTPVRPGQRGGRARRNLRFTARVLWLLFKGFALAGIAIVGLAAVALYFFPALVDAERIRGVLTARLQQLLHRPVAIQRVIVTPQGIKLHGVTVLAEDGTGQNLLESDFAILTVKLRALLQGRVEFSRVRLATPRIHLFRDTQGQWSIADIFVPPEDAPAPNAGLPLPISLGAESTVIENGTLTVEDRLLNRSFLVERFNLAVHEFAIDRPFSFSMAFDNVTRIGERTVSVGMNLEGVTSLAGFDWPHAYVRAAKFNASLAGRKFHGTVALSGFPETQLDANLSAPAIGPVDWEVIAKKPIDLHLPASRWRIVARRGQGARIELQNLSLRAPPLTARLSGRLELGLPQPRLEGQLTLGDFPLESAAAFRPALARYGLKGSVGGQALVSGWTDRLVVSGATVRIRGAHADLPPLRLRGGDLDLAASHEFSRVRVRVARGALSAFTSQFTEIAGSASLEKRDLRLDEIALKWNGARTRLRARVLDLANPKEVAVAGCVAKLRWDDARQLVVGAAAAISTRAAEAGSPRPWVHTFKYAIPKRFPDTIGRVRIGEIAHQTFWFGDTDLMWDVRGVSPSLKRVSGDARVGFGPGRVSDVEAVQNAHKFLRIVFLPYIYMHKMNNLSVLSAATAYPKTLDFNRIEGQYSIREGVVSTRFFHVNSPQLLAYADGLADFGRESVDMNILTRLTGYRAPLPEWWVDEKGRPAIGFRVKGDLNRPDLEPRLRKMGGEEIESAVEAARQRARERFKAIETLKALGADAAGGLRCR